MCNIIINQTIFKCGTDKNIRDAFERGGRPPHTGELYSPTIYSSDGTFPCFESSTFRIDQNRVMNIMTVKTSHFIYY